MNAKQRRNGLLAVGVVIIFVLYASSTSLSILPGFQGEQNGFYSYQPSGQAGVVLNDAFQSASCGGNDYSWSSTATPSAIAVKKSSTYSSILGCQTGSSDTLYAQTQNNLILCGTGQTGVTGCPNFWTPIPVTYSIKNPSNTSQTEVITGQINAYSFNTNLGINSGGSSLSGNGGVAFDGDTIWSSTIDNLWDRLQSGGTNCDPTQATATDQCVFEAPVYGVVSSFVPVNNWANSDCNVCTTGVALTFYSSPSAAGQTLVSLVSSQSSLASINSSLSSVYAPDSRFSSTVFWPISISHLQDSCSILGCAAPQGQIVVTLYTLLLGEYVTGTTNPDKTHLQPNPTQSCSNAVCDLQALGAFFSNPFNLLGLGVYGLVLVAVVVLVAVFAFTGSMPFLNRRRGAKGE